MLRGPDRRHGHHAENGERWLLRVRRSVTWRARPSDHLGPSLKGMPEPESVLYVPLRSNAKTLVTGAPIAALRRRPGDLERLQSVEGRARFAIADCAHVDVASMKVVRPIGPA